MESTGKYIIAFGVIISIIGLIIWLFGNKLTWFGNLPGDIKVEKEHFRFYAPMVSMLLVSVLLTLLLWIFRKFFNN